MGITYTDGGRGTITAEVGKHGGRTLVLRRGFPVPAEVVAGIKAEHVTETLLSALGVDADSIREAYLTMTHDGEW